jgi:BolA protein
LGTLQINITDKIRAKIMVLEPIELDIADVSDKHKGHSGWKEGGQTHFHITIVSDHFIDKSKLERHKIINELLFDEIKMIKTTRKLKKYNKQT